MALAKEYLQELAGREHAVAYYLMLRGYPISTIHRLFSHLLEEQEGASGNLHLPVFLSKTTGPDTVTLPFHRESERVYQLDSDSISG